MNTRGGGIGGGHLWGLSTNPFFLLLFSPKLLLLCIYLVCYLSPTLIYSLESWGILSSLFTAAYVQIITCYMVGSHIFFEMND